MKDPHISPALAAAMDHDPAALGAYMGRDVSSTSVKITKAGDGLSKQLDIDPRILQPGEKYYVLLETTGGAHTHRPIKKADTWELVQELIAQTVTFVEGEDIEKLIRIAADRVQQAEEARKGVQRLDGTDADDLEDDGVVDAEIVEDDDLERELEAEAGGRPDAEWNDSDTG